MALSKRLAVALLAPTAGATLVAVQGARLRRTALRLPSAVGGTAEHGPNEGQPLRLVVVGDSVASGVGIGHHDDTVAGRLAELLSHDRPVHRSVIAESGHTAADTTALVEGRLADADVVVLSVGVNDTKNLHSAGRWREDLTALLASITTQAPTARVVLLGIPPMEVFPAMPRALGLTLGARARVMDRVGRQVVAGFPKVQRMELGRGDFAVDAGPFARDGFHPSETSHAAFAARIHELLHEQPRTEMP